MCERIEREIETNKKNVLNMNAQIEEKHQQIAENEEKIKELTEAFDAISAENSGSFEAVNSAKDELAKIRSYGDNAGVFLPQLLSHGPGGKDSGRYRIQ